MIFSIKDFFSKYDQIRRRDMFLKVVAFLLKIVKIWKNDLTKWQQLFN